MGTIAEQLFKAGLVSERKFREQEAEETLTAERRSQLVVAEIVGKEKPLGCSELDSCATMNDFKFMAKQILLKDPSKIRIIIQKVHRFKEEDQGMRFIWFFYQVRDRLRDLPAARREQALNKMFRKHGSVVND
jgi:hypothetical protein